MIGQPCDSNHLYVGLKISLSELLQYCFMRLFVSLIIRSDSWWSQGRGIMAEKIIIHSLLNSQMVLMRSMNSWNMWGGEISGLSASPVNLISSALRRLELMSSETLLVPACTRICLKFCTFMDPDLTLRASLPKSAPLWIDGTVSLMDPMPSFLTYFGRLSPMRSLWGSAKERNRLSVAVAQLTPICSRLAIG